MFVDIQMVLSFQDIKNEVSQEGGGVTRLKLIIAPLLTTWGKVFKTSATLFTKNE